MAIDARKKIWPAVLLIADSWGIALAGEGNALSQTKTPNFNGLISKYPAAALNTISGSGRSGKTPDIAENYFSLGTSKLKSKKNTSSLFDSLEKAGKKWLIITGAEKLAYGAYFFSGKKKIKKENFILMPSAGSTAEKIAKELIAKIKSGKYDFIAAFLDDLDLAAHSGNYEATAKAAAAIDHILGILSKTVLENSGILFITSSHGHAEELIDLKTEMKNTKDTGNPVPFLIIGRNFEGKTFNLKEAPGNDLSLVAPAGSLLDAAPTILKTMGLKIPAEMEGKPLIN